MAAAIECEGLTKYYGDSPGIIDLDLEVRTGEVFGFLGPNGSGKSTTIRTLLNFLQPTRGSARILGLDILADSLAIRRRVGYLPGDIALYDAMTGRELLAYIGNLRRVDVAARVAELAARFDLDLDRRIRELSTGNRQKVGLINAFMHDPELLILDEPTSGLDPLMQQEFQALVFEARAASRTVFLSSHILPEIDRVADRVGIVRKGRLVAVDTVRELKARAQLKVHLRFARDVEPALLDDLANVISVDQPDPRSLAVSFSGSIDPLLKRIADREVVAMTTDSGELEQVFLAYYAAGGDAE
jgi:ABC-2 type transport system ATP-binding protein